MSYEKGTADSALVRFRLNLVGAINNDITAHIRRRRFP